jgi:hypothetical protein
MNKESLRMQKLAGLITESEYNESCKVIEEGWKENILAGIGLTFASLLPQGLNAQDLTPQDKETIKHSVESVDKDDGEILKDTQTISDTVEYISKDMDRDTLRIITTKAYEIYEDTDGNITKVVTHIKDNYKKYNSWEDDPSKTEESTVIEKMDNGKMVSLKISEDNENNKKYSIIVDGKWRPDPSQVKETYYDTGEITKEEFESYVDKYNYWRSIFDLPPFDEE